MQTFESIIDKYDALTQTSFESLITSHTKEEVCKNLGHYGEQGEYINHSQDTTILAVLCIYCGVECEEGQNIPEDEPMQLEAWEKVLYEDYHSLQDHPKDI